jgi:hypothetical protein
MPTTELTSPTSVLGLFCGETDADAVVASMARQLPAEGVTPGRVGRRFDLMRATYRLLDSRILEAAATALQQDVATPLVKWLATFQNLREAAAKTNSGADGVVVELNEPTPYTSSQGSEVSLYVGDDKVATVTFRLELKVELGKTSASVSHGAIEEIVCAVCCASALFTLEGCPKPLWKPDPVSLPDVHIPVQPAFRIPLIPVPRPRQPSDQPGPRATTGRPPVPGKGRAPTP